MTSTVTRRWWALSALVGCALIMDLDTTVLNVAIPRFASRLHAATGQVQWILNAYTIVMAGLFIPAGPLADRLGRKWVLLPISAGLGGIAAGFALGALTSVDDGVWFSSLWTVMAGLGVGAAMVPAMTVILRTLPAASAGVGAALNQALRGASTAFGVAVLGSLLAAATGSARIGGAPTADAVAGMDAVWAACTVAGVAMAGLVLGFLPGRHAAPSGEQESKHEFSGAA